MSLLELFVLLLVAGVCGALGQAIAGYSRGGCLASIAVGFIGAIIGTWMARELVFPALFTVDIGNTTFPLVWSILGSVVFVAVVNLVAVGPRL
jgi:uncharacterized membrane protein YeaQ/YmgE (transglycosylase-associated protein family)